ncbi:MAG: glycosyltransferase [Brevinematia bacterium]
MEFEIKYDFFRYSFFIIAWLLGFIFQIRLKFIKLQNTNEIKNRKISVIIPVRNESKNISKVLYHLKNQKYKPYEIIVVDDNSEDNTVQIAKNYDVKIISLNSDPPDGWTGKNWALWNGYLASEGELLLFLDADVEPREDFIEVLLSNYEHYKGLISCWPYQRFEKLYEHLNFAFNLIPIFSMFILSKSEGAFGPSILISREDYEKVGGNREIKNKIIEDMALAKKCLEKNIPVNNFLGGEYIKFRMYQSFKDLFEGFTKNMAKGAFSVNFFNFLLIFLFMYGIYGSIFYFKENLINIFYILFVIQFYIISRRLGDYKLYDAILYPIHFLFFSFVFIYSIFRSFFVKTVIWKGRKIRVD